jgi:hypothetical protein
MDYFPMRGRVANIGDIDRERLRKRVRFSGYGKGRYLRTMRNSELKESAT